MQVDHWVSSIIARLFEDATGQILSEDRIWRIETTLTPFCKARNIDTIELLANRIQRASERDLTTDVVDALLNNETSFFRDTGAFAQIADDVLPRLARQRADRRKLRIWSAACSTGQEAYSLAMLFEEQGERWAGWDIEILGTDISRSAINRARDGLYSQFEVQRGLAIRRLLDHFDPVLDQGWRAKPAIGKRITFARHNLVGPPPAGGKFDLILCRNALLYFAPDRRGELLQRLSSAIDGEGMLMLGAGETATGVSDRFVIDSALPSVYRPAGHDRGSGRITNAA